MTHISGLQITPLDLSSCDREPIHIPGAIQPHGMLVAVQDDLTIEHVSANCEQWVCQRPGQLIGRSLDSLLQPDSVLQLRACLAERTETTSSWRTLRFAREHRDPIALHGCAHRSSNLVIIELEHLSATVEGDPTLMFAGQCRVAIHRLRQCRSAEELCQVVTQQLRALTGCDRVMVYQFDEEWNGSVVAEECLECLEPYLGLHYPATDIPAPARAMFLLNGLRAIPDVAYQAVPVLPTVRPRTGQPLDLSRAQLRAVSPIHLEYLRNMGVGASLTIPLVVNGKLWGLIACHHRSRYLPSPSLRDVCELFGQMVSLHLTERIEKVAKQEAEHAKSSLGRLAERVHQFDSIVPALLGDQQDLLALTSAQGAIIWRDGEALPIGATPPLNSIAMLQQWAATVTTDSVYATDSLPKCFPDAEAYEDVACGMLALALSRSPDVYILWFRPEVIQTVHWAGDPSKPIQPVGDDGRLHPRRSFALWKESVRHRSLPWLRREIGAARQLRVVLQDRLARSAEQLGRLLPLCAWCRKVRSDQQYWQQVEEYVCRHTDIRFTHGICPECLAQETARFRQSRGDN